MSNSQNKSNRNFGDAGVDFDVIDGMSGIMLRAPYAVLVNTMEGLRDAGSPPQLVAIAAIHAGLDLVAATPHEPEFRHMRRVLARDLPSILDGHRRKNKAHGIPD